MQRNSQALPGCTPLLYSFRWRPKFTKCPYIDRIVLYLYDRYIPLHTAFHMLASAIDKQIHYLATHNPENQANPSAIIDVLQTIGPGPIAPITYLQTFAV